MKKEDHIKIVRELELKINELEKHVLEVMAVNAKLHGQVELKDFIVQEKTKSVKEILARNINAANFLAKYDKDVKEFRKNSVERMKMSDIKFFELQNYITKTFPTLVVNMKQDEIKKEKDENLSDTFIGEHGEIYKPQHIVDVAIVILDMQRKKLKEILGDDNLNKDTDE